MNENTYIVDNNSNGINNPINKAIDEFKNYNSTLLIQSKVVNDRSLLFDEASLSYTEKELRLLNFKKLVSLKIYFQKF